MRFLFSILLFFAGLIAFGQNEKQAVLQQMKRLHSSLNDKNALVSLVHDSVSYGHSNGWLQNKEDMIIDAGTKTVYHSYKEDSIQVVVSGNTGYARFVADIEVSLNGTKGLYHLKVMEVWLKENNEWKLLARQAMR